jgi:hypothetical protein
MDVVRWGMRAGISAAVLLGAGAVAYASVPKTWNSGDSLAATDLNGNFASLDSRIASLEAAARSPSAFHAAVTVATSIPSGPANVLVFDDADFDLGGEYNTKTGTFTAKRAGTYFVQCTVEYWGNTGSATILFKNGAQLVGQDGVGQTVSNTSIYSLNANDELQCGTYQNTGANQSLVTDSYHRNSFSAARLY